MSNRIAMLRFPLLFGSLFIGFLFLVPYISPVNQSSIRSHQSNCNIDPAVLSALSGSSYVFTAPSKDIIPLKTNSVLCSHLIVFGKNTPEVNPKYPPDSFNVNSFGHSFAQPFPNAESYRYTSHVMSRNVSVRIYTIPLVIRDIYEIKLTLESIDYAWLRNEPIKTFSVPQYTISSTSKLEKVTGSIKVRVRGSSLSPWSFNRLSYCTQADHKGRWVRASLLGDANTGWDVKRSGFTLENALMFIPFECRYHQKNNDAYRKELNGKLVHFYGIDLKRHYGNLLTDNCIDSFCNPRVWNQYIASPPHSSAIMYWFTMTHMQYWQLEKDRVLKRLSKFQAQVLPNHTGFEPGTLLTDPDFVILSFGSLDSKSDFETFRERIPYMIDRLLWTFPNSRLIFRPSDSLHSKNSMQQRRFDKAIMDIFVDRVEVWDVEGMQRGLPLDFEGDLVHEETVLLMNLISAT